MANLPRTPLAERELFVIVDFRGTGFQHKDAVFRHNPMKLVRARKDALFHFFGDKNFHFLERRGEFGQTSHAKLLEHYARTAFVLSPAGGGYECMRTWEALNMGAIPILQRYRPNDFVYEDLPVMWVDEYTPDEINADTLKKTRDEIVKNIAAGKYNMAKLTNSWWMELIRKKATDGYGQQRN